MAKRKIKNNMNSKKVLKKVSKTFKKIVKTIKEKVGFEKEKPKPILEIKGLIAGYGKLEVLHNVTINVNKKEIVALIGPNGAGKSTVIKTIFKLADMTSGQIIFNGKDIKDMQTHELLKAGISYVNQGQIVFDDLTVKENLEIGCTALKDKNDCKKRIEEIHKLFPVLKEREKQYAYTLSGGQRQMLALGRALITKPKLLMLDEPSLGLSPRLQTDLFASILKLRNDEKVAVLIVEQNAKKAIELADRTYVLEDGQIALEGGTGMLRNPHIKNVYLGGRY